MNREIQSFLNTLEMQLEEEMRQPVELQLLNWLDDFLKKVWDAGAKDSNIETAGYNKGYEEGYSEGLDAGADRTEDW